MIVENVKTANEDLMSPQDIEDGLNKLNIVVERFKDGVNMCDMETIIINSRIIDSTIDNIRPNLLTEKQKGLYNVESTVHFDRLYKGRCACSPVKNL